MSSDDLDRHVGRYYGKFRGTVAGNEDDDHQGTLQVTVPDVFGGDTVVAAAACLPYGLFFVPPVGTHIWVEFEAGDPERPIWAGVWHPLGSAPEAARVSPPDHRVITTRAGHTIEIVDTQEEERVLVRHASNAFISIDPSGSVLIANAKGSHLHLDANNGTATLVEQHGNHLTMGEKGTSVVNPDGTMVNVSGGTVHVSAASVVVDASAVALGHGAAEATVLAGPFSQLWKALQLHTHEGAAGPVAPSVALSTVAPQPGVHFSSAVVVA
ncbi:phage baseplate assembly protein V [Geodermatophilus sp. SYSU D00814]